MHNATGRPSGCTTSCTASCTTSCTTCCIVAIAILLTVRRRDSSWRHREYDSAAATADRAGNGTRTAMCRHSRRTSRHAAAVPQCRVDTTSSSWRRLPPPRSSRTRRRPDSRQQVATHSWRSSRTDHSAAERGHSRPAGTRQRTYQRLTTSRLALQPTIDHAVPSATTINNTHS